MRKFTLTLFCLYFVAIHSFFILLLPVFTIASVNPDLVCKSLKEVETLATNYYFSEDERKDDPAIVKNQNLYDVIHNKITLSFDIKERILFGNVKMTALNLSDTLNKIYINFLDNMNVSSVKLNDADINYNRKNNYIIIDSKNQLSKSKEFTVEISYQGKPLNEGFDSFSFKFIDGNICIYNLSEPNYAPNWWPCKDILTDKFLMDMIITVPDDLTAVSNGILHSETSAQDGLKTFHWKSTYPITTYLVSIAVSKYDKWTETFYNKDSSKSMPVEYYSFPNYTEKAKIDWGVTLDMLDFYSEIFGEYPFINEKYGMAMFGWVGGAMEHQTISSMGYTLTTGDRRYENVVAHEIVHQWYGDAVSPATWKDIWLNEGFASYGEALWEEHLNGSKALFSYMRKEDYGGFSGTLYNPEDNLFSTTVYQKGSWVLHMLRGTVGDSTFFNILKTYYEDFKYKSVTTDDFKKVCEKVSGLDLKYFFDQWVYKGTGRPEFEYSWKADPFDGQSSSNAYMIRVNINQIQKDYDLYKSNLRINVKTENGNEEFIVFNDKKNQVFTTTVNSKPVSVTLDEKGWLLKKVKQVDYK